jgi:hypothetical protein
MRWFLRGARVARFVIDADTLSMSRQICHEIHLAWWHREVRARCVRCASLRRLDLSAKHDPRTEPLGGRALGLARARTPPTSSSRSRAINATAEPDVTHALGEPEPLIVEHAVPAGLRSTVLSGKDSSFD